jgi:SH3 domain protein
MKKLFHLGITLWVLAANGVNAADAVFITDRIEVEVLSERIPQSSVVTSLSSGDMVTVTATDGEYSEIQTRDNITGWVLSKYLSKNKPARIEYAQLSAKYNELEQALEQAKTELRSLDELRKEARVARKLSEDLQQAKQHITDLEKDLKKTKTEIDKAPAQTMAGEPKAPNTELPIEPPAQNETINSLDRPRAGADGLPLIPFKIFLAALLVLFLLGAYSGYRYLDYKIRKKHGGVRLY